MIKMQIKLMDLSTERQFYKIFTSEYEMIKYRYKLRQFYRNLIEIKEWF